MFQFILRLAALSHSSLNWLLNFTILSVYDPNKFVIYWTNDPSLLWQLGLYDAEGRYAGLGPLGAHLLMLSIGITSMLAAAYIFKRRDLPAPV
jgi:ABC-type transport system involved in multi-copper enzyme maturation permease subunit